MKNWQVTIKSTEVYCVGVKAETEEEAMEVAHDKIETEEGRTEYWHDSEGEVEVEIE